MLVVAVMLACCMPALAVPGAPDPALLEMLGAMSGIEELGVDVEKLIDDRLDTRPDDPRDERTEEIEE